MRNRAETKIKMTFIRHGKTVSNLEYRYLGTTDEGLSEQGKEELWKRKEADSYRNPRILFTSPMLRCRQTAKILFPGTEYQVIPEWEEMDFGLFEGKNYQELNGNVAYQEWIDSGGTLPFPDGESREEFTMRVLRGFERMLLLIKNTGADLADTEVTAVVHGGTIMALCSELLGGEYFDYQIQCGEVYQCYLPYFLKQ